MVWCLVVMLVVMVGICMHLLAGRAGWQERAKEAESIIADLMPLASADDSRRAYVLSRLRFYAARWGMVVTKDNIVEKESK